MTCPDWRALAAHRYDPRGAEPAGWQEAVAHLDRCRACRREALAADPTLLFRSLAAPVAGVQGWGSDDAEAEAMRRSVAALRGAARVERRAGSAAASAWRWRRWAAAAVLAGATLSLQATREVEEAPFTAARRLVPAVSAGGVVPAAFHATPAGPLVPLVVEDLNRPDARVYQMQDEDLSVVMVVDEGLDV